MGSTIHLGIGRFEVDWGRNYGFTQLADLFQPHDVKLALYRYVGEYGAEDGEPIELQKEAAVRPLERMVGRLELLGFTLESVRRKYAELLAEARLDEPPMSFDLLAALLCKLDVDAGTADYDWDYDLGEFFAGEIFDRLGLSSHGFNPRDARYELGAFMENLSPLILLRLLAENPKISSRDVTWAFADVMDYGWASREDLIKSLGVHQRFLVVTEGSSDAKMLKRALELLRPDVADFFYFVDMEAGYPFTGTGNLHKFTQGLASIAIKNSVVVVYDNDPEGVSKFAETSGLSLPSNIRVMKLPDHQALSTFSTVGPQGDDAADINGRAAALECYLDLSWKASEPPVVRWTSYNRQQSAYQGELLNKQAYMKRFLGLREPVVGYDFSKLDAVLTALLSECVAIATQS